MTRFVLLREFPAHLDVEQTPDEDYVRERNFAIEQKPYRIRTDAHGFILSGNPIPPGAARMIAIGDSVCENLYVEEHERIWSVLSRALSRHRQQPIEVLNGGVSGNHLLHVVNLVLNKVLPLKPQAVIFLGGATDYAAAASQSSYWSANPQVCTILQKTKPEPPFPQRALDFSEMKQLLGLLSDACAAFGIPIIFLTVPFTKDKANGFHEALEHSNEVIRSVCISKGLPLVDLENLFDGSTGYAYDAIHLNSRGSARVSEAIFASHKLPE